MNAADRAYLSRLVELGCCVCRFGLGIAGTPAEVHHPRTGSGMARRAKHADGIPLCPNHHRLGNDSIHVMGRRAWERHWGFSEMELLAKVRELMA